jgi:long-chain acyl-CoA synthetase
MVCQGYGLTETMAGACISMPDSHGGNVGPPLPGVQLRLESSPELNYDALGYPPRGEVLINGGIISKGYYKLESTTKEVLEPSGWFHTGDIGEITGDGVLKIIDRKKNIFKL